MKTPTSLLASLVLTLAIASCSDAGRTPTTVTNHAQSHSHAQDHDMGDASATPATQVAGAELASGKFMPLDSKNVGSSVTGVADMARHDAGTTVTIQLEGLEPSTDYISHVHERGCSEGGGPHYKFDPDGDHHPPNEIHLAFTSDESGHGFMTVENHQVALESAMSVIIHEAGPDSPKVACADL